MSARSTTVRHRTVTMLSPTPRERFVMLTAGPTENEGRVPHAHADSPADGGTCGRRRGSCGGDVKRGTYSCRGPAAPEAPRRRRRHESRVTEGRTRPRGDETEAGLVHADDQG